RDKKFANNFGGVYANGNIIEGNEQVTKDNWAGGIQIAELPDAGRYSDSIRKSKPYPMAKITLLTAKQAYDYVLDNAGATLPKRDAVDARIVREVRTGKIEYVPNTDNSIG